MLTAGGQETPYCGTTAAPCIAPRPSPKKLIGASCIEPRPGAIGRFTPSTRRHGATGSTSDNPVVLVTRTLPDAVERCLGSEFEVRVNPDDRQYSSDLVIELVAGSNADREWAESLLKMEPMRWALASR